MTRFDTLADKILNEINLGKIASAAGVKGAIKSSPKGNFLDQLSKKMGRGWSGGKAGAVPPAPPVPDLPVVGGDRDLSILDTPEPNVPDMMRWDPTPAKGENPAYDPRTGKSLGPNTAAFNKKYGVQQGTPRPPRPRPHRGGPIGPTRPRPTPTMVPRATPPPLNLDPSKGPVG
jgi:hypothetical protein